MRVTQWGEYGILFSIFLAEKKAASQPIVSAVEIAESQGIALQYTQQILLRLREGGVVESVRGPRGGFRLCKEAEDLSLREVLVAAEGDTFELICETKPIATVRCDPSTECVLRPIWYELRETVDTYLESVTIQTLLDRSEAQSVEAEAPITIGSQKASQPPSG